MIHRAADDAPASPRQDGSDQAGDHTPATLFDHVLRQAQQRPDAIALRGAGTSVSYLELAERSQALASRLLEAGIGRGDVIALQLPNTRQFVTALLASAAIGATAQMVHMPYRESELAFLLAHSGARAFIGLTQFRGESPTVTVTRLMQAQPSRLPALRLVLAADAPEFEPDEAPKALPAQLASPTRIAASERFVLLYTSGTTADPKGVPIEHHRFMNNALASIAPLQMTADDVLLSAAPFTHLYGLFVLELALLSGASLSLLPAFTPPDMVTATVRDRVTAIFGGPAHFKPLLDQQAMQTKDFGHLRFVCLSGTAVPPALAREVESHLNGGVVIQLWGMSELQAGSYGRPDDPPGIRLETAGRPSPGTELRIVNESGKELARGADGRLEVRGPSVFAGYLNNDAATRSAFSDGWFDTGDTARLTSDGALVITGRVKELINRGGVKFNPIDVEALLDRVPGVERCVLVPMPDPVLGERACAFVKKSGQGDVTLAALTAALAAAGVAKFKWPERLEFIDDMPLTPTQKVMRARLAERLR